MTKTNNAIIPNNVIAPTVSLNDFFKNWLIFLKPYHELAERLIDVAASFLKIRYELSKVILDDNILNETIMSENTKRKVIEDCDLSSKAHFQVIMSALKQHKFFIDDKINPKYIPNLKITEDRNDPNSFSLMILWRFK